MALPSSLSDLFFIVVIVMPGYFSLYIFRWLAYLEKRFSDQDILFLSLTLSVVIYVLTGFLCDVQDFNEIKNIILDPGQAAILFSLTVILGALPGYGVRWWLDSHNITPGDAWVTVIETALENDQDVWVLVNTEDGKEYKGKINYYDAGDEENSLSISNPMMILRDDDKKIKDEFKMGEEIVFKERNLSRLVFLKEIE